MRTIDSFDPGPDALVPTRRRPLALIAAVSANGVIGRDGGLPWHIPEDLRHFRAQTMGHAVIMGRKTWESIGKPLKKRRNIVVTRRRGMVADGCEVALSLHEALDMARQSDAEPRIIGGATLYAEAMPLATKLILTEIPWEVEGDVLFPPWEPALWKEIERREGEAVTFRTLERSMAGL